MQLIYCLINKSLNDNIVSIGVTKSLSTLKQTLQIINSTYLPTPYTIYLTKNVKTSERIDSSERIDFIYSILNKFGRHINGTFFEISLDFIEPLFNLIQDDKNTDNKILQNEILQNEILQNEYLVIQDKIEYIIPFVVGPNAVGPSVVETKKVESNISSIILETDTHYDKLSRYKNTYSDLDL